jgi:hypothetical protein
VAGKSEQTKINRLKALRSCAYRVRRESGLFMSSIRLEARSKLGQGDPEYNNIVLRYVFIFKLREVITTYHIEVSRPSGIISRMPEHFLNLRKSRPCREITVWMLRLGYKDTSYFLE